MNPLSQSLIDQFGTHGVVRFPKLLPDIVVAEMQAAVTRRMQRLGVCEDGKWIEPDRGRWQLPLVKAIKVPFKKHAKLEALVTPDITASASALAGSEVAARIRYPQLLFTPPNTSVWSFPTDVWHLDYPRLGDDAIPGVQMFACINHIRPQGGGTIVVSGSHRFLNNEGYVRSRDLKKKLKQLPYFGKLLNGDAVAEHYMQPQEVEGISCKAVELCGDPGDVWFTDLRILHTPSYNALGEPRIAVTQRFFTASSSEVLNAIPD